MVLDPKGTGRVGRRRFDIGPSFGAALALPGGNGSAAPPKLDKAMPIALSTLGIVLIVLGVVVILFFIGGVLAVRVRNRRQAGSYAEHVAQADAALEQARASDRGWDRDVMEEAARTAIAEARGDWDFNDLHLVLVDDRPGTEEDRARFVAVAPDAECHVTLARNGDRWVAERVE